jgi:hypothetical protein
MAPPTSWEHMCGSVGLPTNDGEPPRILGAEFVALTDDNAEPVLSELEADPALQWYVAYSRQQRRLHANYFKSAQEPER